MSQRILCVGLVVVDLVTVVEHFPLEDTKSRCDELWHQVGGNAANNCRILSILGEKPSYMGNCGTTPEHLSLIRSNFDKFDIDMTGMVIKEHPVPFTVCILSKSSGSRTCVHYRGSLPELSFDDFAARLNLSFFKWIHFEVRYEFLSTRSMLRHLLDQRTAQNLQVRVSVEIESNKCSFDSFADIADYIFVSKEFSKHNGYTTMEEAAAGLASRLKDGGVVICPWGDQGAAAMQKGCDSTVVATAHPPKQVLNTLGAGDTFIAATIKALSNGQSLQSALNYACQVAGAKVGLLDEQQLALCKFEEERA